MSHEILIRETDQKAVLAFTAGDPGWHKLGTPVPAGSTVTEFLNQAEAGKIIVEKRGLFTQTADGLYVPYGNKVALKRLAYAEQPDELDLGEVDPNYEVIQNSDLARMLEPIGKHAPIDVMGVLYKGAVTFFTFKANLFEILIKTGNKKKAIRDEQVLYLLVLEDKRPGNAVKFILSTVRPVCANTTDAAEAAAMWQMNISHRKGANDMVSWTADVMGQLASRQKALQQAMQSMADTRINDDQVPDFILSSIPLPGIPDKVQLGRMHFGDRNDPEGLDGEELRRWDGYMLSLSNWEGKIKHAQEMHSYCLAAYQDSPTQQSIQGTVWGALNAVTFGCDHFQDTDARKTVALANLNGYRREYKLNAWRQATALVTANINAN